MEIKDLPDVSFCETDADVIESNAIKVFEGITGRTLAPGNPERLFLEGLIALIVQQRAVINTSGKQNLLGYAQDDFLDHLGAITETPRLETNKATTTLRFSMAGSLDFAVGVDAGSRVSSGDGSIIFKTVSYGEISVGEASVDVESVCIVAGSAGNGYLPGQVNRMVDVVPYILTVENTTITAGGADIEGNDEYRDRIHKSPSKFSVAGPGPAYEYWAKTAHQDIIDVAVFRDDPLGALLEVQLESILTVLGIGHAEMTLGEKRIRVGTELSPSRVNVFPLLKNGEIPDSEILGLVNGILTDKKVRPLTDHVVVAVPVVVSYDLEFTYFVSSGDIPAIASIQANVAKAVAEYLIWQRSKIKRDINPDKLTQLVKNAGAKRLEIASPAFQTLTEGQVAHEATVSVNYGGAENE